MAGSCPESASASVRPSLSGLAGRFKLLASDDTKNSLGAYQYRRIISKVKR